MSAPRKILAYSIGSLGDSIVAIPALRTLRANFTKDEIVLLHETGRGLVEPPDVIPVGLVDRYFHYKRADRVSNAFAFLDLLIRLRRERFSAAAYLVFSERPAASVHRDAKFFRACGISDLYGFHAFSDAELYPRDNEGRPQRVPGEAERKISRLIRDGLSPVENAMALPWISPAPPDIDAATAWLRARSNGSRVLAVAPGCKTKANEWPIRNFIEMIRLIRQKSDIDILIVGGAAEAAIARQIGDALPNIINAAGECSVSQSAALLSLCEAYVGPDTGTTHLAAAVGLPVVTICHQRNNPGQWFPVATQLELLQTEVPCAGCRAQVCPVPGHPCMTGISAAAAASAVVKTLKAVQPTRTAAIL